MQWGHAVKVEGPSATVGHGGQLHIGRPADSSPAWIHHAVAAIAAVACVPVDTEAHAAVSGCFLLEFRILSSICLAQLYWHNCISPCSAARLEHRHCHEACLHEKE